MMRLLCLCLLLLLPTAAGSSEPIEGSADGVTDDEDLTAHDVFPEIRNDLGAVLHTDETKGAEDSSDQLTLIVIIVAVTALTLSVGAIVTIMLVRRRMHNQQQGIYTVPIEQHHKGV